MRLLLSLSPLHHDLSIPHIAPLEMAEHAGVPYQRDRDKRRCQGFKKERERASAGGLCWDYSKKTKKVQESKIKVGCILL